MSDREFDVLLGRRLRTRRRLLGMTQEELGRSCGVRFQQIQKYESAANRLSATMLFRLAQALDVPVAYFFDGCLTASRPTPIEETRQWTGQNA